MPLRVITWNVARRRSGLIEQAKALAARAPAIVALQEVTPQTLPLWRRALALIGLEHVRCSLDSAAPERAPAARRRTGVVLASRAPLDQARRPLSLPWPETGLCAAAEMGQRAVEVFCVHVPNAANGAVKPQTLRALRAGVELAGEGIRIVCGDLNTPRRELPTGEVISFARDRYGRLRPERGPEWDEAELGVVPGLRDLGYRDAFRVLHGYAHREPSWTWRRIAGHGGGWRLDHVFASPQLEPIHSVYHHGWREDGLSDHSALEADFELMSEPGGAQGGPTDFPRGREIPRPARTPPSAAP
jgi:exodeoxyribonuclease III